MNLLQGFIFTILINYLLRFNALIEQGHSLLVIEHNTDVMKNADWLIDLGPEAGDAGGKLVYAGVPAGIREEANSYTGKFMA